MHKQILTIIILLLSLIIAGCSSGGSNCNQTYGVYNPAPTPSPRPEPTPPTPTPDPTPPTPTPDRIYRNLDLVVLYPNGTLITDFTITVNKLNIFLVPPTIGPDGKWHYVINPEIPHGTEFIIRAEKEGITFEPLTVILDEDRITLPDGTYLYEKEILGYASLVANNVKYVAGTWRITSARFCTYTNGIVAIPGTPPAGSGTLMANGFYLVDTDDIWYSAPRIGKMEANGQFISFVGGKQASGTISDDGIGDDAKFVYPHAIVISSDAGTLYVTDASATGARIRKIDTATRQVTTIVELPGVYMQWMPCGLTMTPDENYLYLGVNNSVYKIDLSDNSYTTVSTGFNSIYDLAWDTHPSSNQILYVLENYGTTIKTFNLQTQEIAVLTSSLTTAWGRGAGITVSANGNTIYASDGYAVTTVHRQTGAKEVIVNNLPDYVQGLTIASDGKTMFVISGNRHYIFHIDLTEKYSTVLLGGKAGYHGFQEGYASSISSSYMSDLVFSPDGQKVYIVNPSTPSVILCFDYESGLLETFAGDGETGATGNVDGIGQNARFTLPWGICIAEKGKYLYVTDRSHANIRRIDTATKMVTTVSTTAALSNPYDIDVSPNGKFLYVADGFALKKIELENSGQVTSIGSFDNLKGVAVSADGTKVYVMSSVGISVIDAETNTVSVPPLSTGSGSGTLFNLQGGYITLSLDGKDLFVTNGQRVVRVRIADGDAKTVAGHPTTIGNVVGAGDVARFNTPYGIAVNPAGNTIYVADFNNSVIRRIIAIID